MTGARRRSRLAEARLYLCSGILDGGSRLSAFLDAVLAAGVDVVQLREKHADARAQLAAAQVFRAACDAHGALFVFNDRADLALAAGADGVHVGQEDLPPAHARTLVGPDLLVGLSTHSLAELRAAHAQPVDYIGVGPVRETPTKQGRPGTGVGLVREAAAEARLPWFVTGGIDATSVLQVVGEGATRVVVVRALTEARDPGAAARTIRAALEPVGASQ